MRVALADDSALFRRGLAALLTSTGAEVCAEARTADELLARLPESQPDVVVLDIRMPPTFTDEGLQAADRIRSEYPKIGILVLSTYAQSYYATRLLKLGSGTGYLLKDQVDDIGTLGDALSRVRSGESVIDTDIVTRLLARQRRASVLDDLTMRERQVLQLMAEGHSNAGITQHLFLSGKTVEAHIAAVFTKLGLHYEASSNRRVRAVLTWLRAIDGAADPEP